MTMFEEGVRRAFVGSGGLIGTGLWFGLHVARTSADSDDAPTAELTGTNYDRQNLLAANVNVRAADGEADNAVEIVYASPGAGGWSAAPAYVVAHDSRSGGKPIAEFLVSPAVVRPAEGSNVRIGVGALVKIFE